MQPAQRKQHVGEALLGEPEEEVALVLASVHALEQVIPLPVMLHAGVVPVARKSHPSSRARSSSAPNLRWRLHATQGLGVSPAS